MSPIYPFMATNTITQCIVASRGWAPSYTLAPVTRPDLCGCSLNNAGSLANNSQAARCRSEQVRRVVILFSRQYPGQFTSWCAQVLI